MEPGLDTEGSVSKPTEGQAMEQMSLTPDIKADLERLAAHSSNEEERKQAQAALKELEERTTEQLTPGQRYLRARHGLSARVVSFRSGWSSSCLRFPSSFVCPSLCFLSAEECYQLFLQFLV